MKKLGKKRLESVEVAIVKMKESSGNEQFFVKLLRTDIEKEKTISNLGLDYSCWQTKNLEKEECLSRAWFDASILARFSGLNSVDDIILKGFDESEILMIKQKMALRF